MKNQKGFAHLFLVIAIVVICIGGLLHFSWQKGLIKTNPNQQPSPTPNTSIDETANWNTYKNNEYGFEFKYPPDWKEKQTYGKKGFENLILFGKKEEDSWSVSNGDLTFQRYINSQNLPFKDYILDYMVNTQPLPDDPEERMQSARNTIMKMNDLNFHGYDALMLKDSTIYIYLNPDIISLNIYSPQTKEHKLIFNQILSTFEFVDNQE